LVPNEPWLAINRCWLTGDPIANIKLLEDPGQKLGRHHERRQGL
jgi:hypothetical protein